MTRIPFILLSTSDGSPITGAAPTVTISKDGGAFASATNNPAEIGNGYYYVDLTTAETTVNNNVIIRATATGAQPTAVVWEPEPTIPTAADNATAVWGAQTKIVNIESTQAETFATASSVANIATVAGAIKAKTDNLPQTPAAVTDVTTAKGDIIAAMPDISNLSTFDASEDVVNISISSANAIRDGLSTFDPETDAVTINSVQAATMVTADVSGLATQTDISDAVTDLENYGQEHWQTANLSGLATSSELANTQEDIISAMPDISGLPTAADIWDYTDRTLTEEISVEISSENIADITESVWNADDRTLTDLTPKPNQKNIVCTPSNVINSYGIPRLENWTNETAGTEAFDDKINTYITLAKEKMATDLNDQINAAIAYIGADNITELCAWLTGYNLYQDDESTDTDSLPETRYNQYLEQIHRIMENI